MKLQQEDARRFILRTASLFVVMFSLAIASCSISAIKRARDCRGTLSGTVASVETDKIDDEVASDVPYAKILLQFKETQITVVANEIGDYYGTSLECGDYKLNQVIAMDGTQLHPLRSQHIQFSVHKNKDTRFDVVVLRATTP
jgi:hypothetical protein